MFKAPNKIIFNQDKKKEWEIHQQKIQNVKCSVDHLNITNSIVRSKHHNFFQQLELQKSNDQHVKRLLSIQGNTSMRTFNLNYSISAMNQNRTNNNSISVAANITSKNIPQHGTLHQGFFKKQQQQRDQDNQMFFKRIQDTKSIFDVKKWAHEADEHKKILIVRSEFPKYYHSNMNAKLMTKGANDKSGSAFNYGTMNNTGRGDDLKEEYGNEKNESGGNNPNNLNVNNMSSILKENSSIIDINNQSITQNAVLNANNESINFTEHPSMIAVHNNQDHQDKNKFVTVNNITVPAAFYHTMQSDTERTNFLKKIIRESRKIIYRKTAEIQDETFFTEIKIESGQFKIELENARGEIYKHEISEAEGIKFFQKECNDSLPELFKRIKLNRSDRTLTLQRQRQVVVLQPIDLKTQYKSGSMFQTKHFQSTEMLSKGEALDSDDDNNGSRRNIKAGVNKSQDGHMKQSQKMNLKPSISDALLTDKSRLKSNSPSSKEKLIKITSKKHSSAFVENKGMKKNEQSASQKDILSTSNSKNINIKQVAKPQVNNKQSQQSAPKQPQQASKRTSDLVQKGKNPPAQNAQKTGHGGKEQVKKQNEIQNKTKNGKNEKAEDSYEEDYDEFDDLEDEEEIKKDNQHHNPTKGKQQEAKHEETNVEDEYEDPFDKFDEEEEQKKKVEDSQKSPQEVESTIVHHHEEPNKKMIKFSFNDMGYKKNTSQESFQSKQNPHDQQQNKIISPKQKANLGVEHKEVHKNQDTHQKKEEQPKKEEEVKEKEEEGSVEYEEEFDLEEDSGTQYEINDEDKDIIEHQNQQQQNSSGVQQNQKSTNQKQQKQQQQEEKEEIEDEYDADFD